MVTGPDGDPVTASVFVILLLALQLLFPTTAQGSPTTASAPASSQCPRGLA
jgi:hypothetical protein